MVIFTLSFNGKFFSYSSRYEAVSSVEALLTMMSCSGSRVCASNEASTFFSFSRRLNVTTTAATFIVAADGMLLTPFSQKSAEQAVGSFFV